MIRSLSQQDLPELVRIEVLTQPFPWPEAIFEQCFKSGCQGWLIELESIVVGFIIVKVQLDECHILDVCIHPDYQGQGFGYQMLSKSLEELKAKKVRIAYLEVRRSNLRAIALYEKLNFVEIDIRKGYYPAKKGREDGIVFAKDLRMD